MERSAYNLRKQHCGDGKHSAGEEERLRYGHFVWHLFVIAGSSCHFAAVFICAI